MSSEDRPFNDFRYCIDCTSLENLGWAEQLPFTEGIDKTCEWYKTHKNWWHKD
jgi:dTDP-D-glucose 4,6-dehydratase